MTRAIDPLPPAKPAPVTTGNSTLPFLITGDGKTVVGVSSADGSHYAPFVWTEDVGTAPLDLNGSVEPVGITADGHLVLTRDRGLVDIFTKPPPEQTPVGMFAQAMSDDGQTVVGKRQISDSLHPLQAMIWQRSNLSPIVGAIAMADMLQANGVDLAGEFLQDAADISSNGRTIVGRTYRGGAWVATSPAFPPPRD